jgi:hypothetical protein
MIAKMKLLVLLLCVLLSVEAPASNDVLGFFGPWSELAFGAYGS